MLKRWEETSIQENLPERHCEEHYINGPSKHWSQQVLGFSEMAGSAIFSNVAYTSYLASQIQFPNTQNRDNLYFKGIITYTKKV